MVDAQPMVAAGAVTSRTAWSYVGVQEANVSLTEVAGAAMSQAVGN